MALGPQRKEVREGSMSQITQGLQPKEECGCCSQASKEPLTVLAEEHSQDPPSVTGGALVWRPGVHSEQGCWVQGNDGTGKAQGG